MDPRGKSTQNSGGIILDYLASLVVTLRKRKLIKVAHVVCGATIDNIYRRRSAYGRTSP